jgi:hypothetical protein
MRGISPRAWLAPRYSWRVLQDCRQSFSLSLFLSGEREFVNWPVRCCRVGERRGDMESTSRPPRFAYLLTLPAKRVGEEIAIRSI